ncbi:hypothetical protein ACIBKY_46510 [Nonomuraea sp. NPDC050394]|uniref:hypothetical protein n=1 Tax=Nonomuraea sp. NPDC050394 TaxID=3364363 RepID=UPI0037ACC530
MPVFTVGIIGEFKKWWAGSLTGLTGFLFVVVCSPRKWPADLERQQEEVRRVPAWAA